MGCGLWRSVYDDLYVESARKLDVDHLVLPAAAWHREASGRSAKEREAYANDRNDPRALDAEDKQRLAW
ncbi:hypothetical protein [Streptomyces sp. NBC_00038]|uniref:hypothetical protein n=1 Tax=Streptomyces sp. NBC_00038 TaxID=2903615 RepID=UPI0022584720|nr:hypothetical protein [Streptomyces sp. NBC_00038]MCX5562995.1 hypothetical protein [Streptomyces sp. NBC_00038]